MKTVLVGTDEFQVQEMRIQQVIENQNRIMLFFDGYETRNDAETLIGKSLFVSEKDMLPPPTGMHFVHDLVGCAVFLTNGEQKGVIKDVMLLPANNVYVVEFKGRDVLIPAVPEFIREVRISEKKIIIDIIPGLYEDDDED